MKDRVVIGVIDDFEEWLSEVAITNKHNKFSPSRLGECRVSVYSNEGPIPHVHIEKESENFHCCVRLQENYFFSHGNLYRNTLNSNQCKIFDKWMRKESVQDHFHATNWEIAVSTWNTSNPDYKCSNITEMPDYRSMHRFKDN